MGRRCLEKHLKTPEEWSNKCPICRDVWFHTYVPDRSEGENEGVGEEGTEMVFDASELIGGLRRSRRIAERYGGGSGVGRWVSGMV
jgi:hypothetical protein